MERPAHTQKREQRALRAPFIRAIYSGNRAALFITAASLLISSLLDVGLAYIMKQVFDEATGGTVEGLMSTAVMAVALFFVIFALLLLTRRTRGDFIRKGVRQYKARAFEMLTDKSISAFGHENTARYISVLTNDVVSIENNYIGNIFEIITNVTVFVGAIALMLYFDWSLTLVSIGLSVLPLVISFICGGRLAAAEKKVSDRSESLVSMVKDILSGFAVVKSFKAEREIQSLFARENEGLEDVKRSRRRTSELIGILGEGVSFMVQSGIMFYGAFLAIKGRITVGTVLAFVQLLNYVLMPIRELPGLISNRRAARGLIDKLALAAQLNTDNGGSKSIDGVGSGIEIKNLTVSYDEDKPVLKGVSQKFDAGRSYAVVGGSGSGKSTLLNLLLGSFPDYSGEALIDGVEIREISPDSLYDTISIIQQSVFVFDSSIRNNVTMFKDFPDAAVDDALRRAGLYDMVEERGGDYRCGENGTGLSGGERQRISIARCLLRNTPVLLMDEATAALDAATAFAVTDSILNIDGLTRIIVTHRLDDALLKKYDEIIVMRNGEICERGGFDELIGRKDYFYSLYTVASAG